MIVLDPSSRSLSQLVHEFFDALAIDEDQGTRDAVKSFMAKYGYPKPKEEA